MSNIVEQTKLLSFIIALVKKQSSSLKEDILNSVVIKDDIDALATAVWLEDLSGTTSGTRLINLNGVPTDISTLPADVWAYIIDNTKNESAKTKLRKIASKTQDIALS